MNLRAPGQSERATRPDATGQGWFAVLHRDIPARILFALSSGDGFVVLSGEETVAAEQLPVVISRLHEAGLKTISITAPLPRLAVLDEALRGAMTPDLIRPFVVIIERAEKLAAGTLERLIALSELRQAGRPVLRFLLSGTPALWTVLRETGLGDLEGDAAVHVRLMPDLTPGELPPQPRDPPPSPAPSLAPSLVPGSAPDLAPSRPSASEAPIRATAAGTLAADAERGDERGFGAATLAFAVVLLLAGIGAAFWLLKPGPSTGTGAPLHIEAQSADDRLAVLLERENKEIAANHLWSPAGDNLMETRRDIDALLPLLSPRALHSLTEAAARADAATSRHAAEIPHPAAPDGDAPPPAVARPLPAPVSLPDGLQPFGDPAHVTVRYSRGDAAAEARAARILILLHGRGMMADGPIPTDRRIERSSLTYRFPQDAPAAADLAHLLLPRTTASLQQAGTGETPRPGEITLSVGSTGETATTQPPG